MYISYLLQPLYNFWQIEYRTDFVCESSCEFLQATSNLINGRVLSIVVIPKLIEIFLLALLLTQNPFLFFHFCVCFFYEFLTHFWPWPLCMSMKSFCHWKPKILEDIEGREGKQVTSSTRNHITKHMAESSIHPNTCSQVSNPKVKNGM